MSLTILSKESNFSVILHTKDPLIFRSSKSDLLFRRRTLKSTLHPAIFWEMVKFVDLGVLYFSLVLATEPTWVL